MTTRDDQFDDAGLASAMRRLAATDMAQAPAPPDPRHLWLKAEFSARQKRHHLISNVANVAYTALATVLMASLYVISKSEIPNAPSIPMPEMTASVALPVVAEIVILLLLFVPGRRRSVNP